MDRARSKHQDQKDWNRNGECRRGESLEAYRQDGDVEDDDAVEQRQAICESVRIGQGQPIGVAVLTARLRNSVPPPPEAANRNVPGEADQGRSCCQHWP